MDVLKLLREKDGCSQDELAKRLGVSRQTIIKYERNCASVPMHTIRQLSEIFDVPIETFTNGKIPATPAYNILPQTVEKLEGELRIDIPQENVNKFKEVLLYVLEKVGAKSNVGQTVLYKLLYFIDFDYYELYEKQLIGAKYIKNHHGPTPVDFTRIVEQMIESNELEVIKTKHFNYDQTKYLPRRRANIQVLSDSEITHIDVVLRKHSDKNASELSDYSHKDIPWIATEERQCIPYEAVFYRTPETSVREYSIIGRNHAPLRG